MDPLSQLKVMHLQDPLPTPLDLTKQISEALDLVKKKPSQSICASGTESICSPRSEFARVPLNTSLPNRLEPGKLLITAMGNGQADGATMKKTKRGRTRPSRSRSRFSLPDVQTLSSEFSRSGVIQVPPSVLISNGASRTQKVREHQKGREERMESSSPNLIELDALQDSDSVDSRNVPSTSEAENTDCFKPTKNGQKRAPGAKKNTIKPRRRSSSGKKATASVAKRTKKKKKKRSGSSSSVFPSCEPEIKLKYASFTKEERQEGRGSTFAPYVRMEFSACTVINFEEDREFQVRKHRRLVAPPGIVPTTSCLQLGRLGSEGRSQTGELCCLCGWTANAAGLGDLHGPYLPDRKTPSALMINGHEDSGAKGKRTLDEVGERWVHEDCSIWSAGIFLVKGRLYGLDEAVRIAQQAVCSCCHRCGATLGCFFKGCPNKYHFPCALQAECLFNEENFTLRCPKHKNKPGLPLSRLQNR